MQQVKPLRPEYNPQDDLRILLSRGRLSRAAEVCLQRNWTPDKDDLSGVIHALLDHITETGVAETHRVRILALVQRGIELGRFTSADRGLRARIQNAGINAPSFETRTATTYSLPRRRGAAIAYG